MTDADALATLVARAEDAFARGDLDAALADVEVAAAAIADGAPPAVAARLSWLVAAMALAGGDSDAFADAALAALEVAPVDLVDELTAALRRVTAAAAATSPLAAIGARFDLDPRELAVVAMLHRSPRRQPGQSLRASERLLADRLVLERGDTLALAPSVRAFLEGQGDGRLLGAAEASAVPEPFGATDALVLIDVDRDQLVGELMAAAGRRALTIAAEVPPDAALDALRDARLRDAVLVIRGVPVWLGAIGRRPGLVLVVAPPRSAGRALAALRPSRGPVAAWRDPADAARPRVWAPLPDELAALVGRDDGGIVVDRAGEPGRVAALIGEPGAIGDATQAIAGRTGLRWIAIDLAVDGLAAARDALAAGPGVVALLGAGGVDAVAAAALAGAARATPAITLVGAPVITDIPAALRAACEVVVSLGDATGAGPRSTRP